jgi:hypothetical protein
MRITSIVGAGALLVFSGGASAEDWHNIQTAGDPAVSIDIPAAVNQVKDVDPAKGELMAFFAENAEGDEDLECFLNRGPYSEKMNRAAWEAALQTSNNSLLCETSGDTISNYQLDTSGPATSNGYGAATCDAAYTDSRQKMKGIVTSVLTVAAPDAIYSLTCNVNTSDRDEAIAAWMADWKDTVSHIQQSLHLPTK